MKGFQLAQVNHLQYPLITRKSGCGNPTCLLKPHLAPIYVQLQDQIWICRALTPI